MRHRRRPSRRRPSRRLPSSALRTWRHGDVRDPPSQPKACHGAVDEVEHEPSSRHGSWPRRRRTWEGRSWSRHERRGGRKRHARRTCWTWTWTCSGCEGRSRQRRWSHGARRCRGRTVAQPQPQVACTRKTTRRWTSAVQRNTRREVRAASRCRRRRVRRRAVGRRQVVRTSGACDEEEMDVQTPRTRIVSQRKERHVQHEEKRRCRRRSQKTHRRTSVVWRRQRGRQESQERREDRR